MKDFDPQFKDLSAFLDGQLLFASAQEEEETFHQSDLIQLFSYGISLTPDAQRPFLLLKDANQAYTLPVAISPIEAGVTISQNSKSSIPANPHAFLQLLMQSLEVRIQQAVFVQIKGAHQYIRLYLSGHPRTNSLKMRADEAMSLCLTLGVPIFATKAFINQSKLLSAQLEGFTQNLLQNQKALLKNHSYLM